jgi:hypothetical protein
MTLAAIGTILFAPARSVGGGFHVSTTTLVIIVVVVVLGGIAIIGWRSPDRSPGAEERAEREKED